MKITDESIKAERQQNNISKERLERILNGNGDTKVEKLEDISISWVREYFDTLSDTEKEYIRSYYKGTMARDFVAV
ncbi:MAG: hypothetical protein LBC61_04855 [Candidatus Peribacteria bacterium]|nr:hypothetical protein [Candidatus Peribacteria bacterium]